MEVDEAFVNVILLGLVAGLLLGAAYFHSLWWTTRRTARGSPVLPMALAGCARFGALAGALSLAARLGAAFLLALVLGLLVARRVATDRVHRGMA